MATLTPEQDIEEQFFNWLKSPDSNHLWVEPAEFSHNTMQVLSSLCEHNNVSVDRWPGGRMALVHPHLQEIQQAKMQPGGFTQAAFKGPSFSHERYNEILDETIEQIRSLGTLKGGEYAGDVDRLANFRRNAERLGINMETCWGVYAGKHWDAIQQFILDLNTGKERKRLESLSGRADDLIVYLILFKCMLEEREAANGTDQ